MPWTFAHPAAVLPLLRLTGPARLSFAALVIGSMSPDFGYYVAQYRTAFFAHSPLGILTVCLPAGLLVLLLARWLREPVARLLPQPHRAALLATRPAPEVSSLRSWFMAVMSLALGAATHVLWDAFTHEGRFVAQQFSVLREPLFAALNREFLVVNALQHASTAIGCVCLAWAYWRHVSAFGDFGPVAPDDRRRYALLAGLVAAAFACAVPFAVVEARGQEPELFASILLVRQVIYTTTAFFVLLVLAAWWEASRAMRAAAQRG